MGRRNSMADITAVQIANATPGQLICITYQLILEQIGIAKKSKGKDEKAHKKAVERAQKFLRELMDALDFQHEISLQLMELYLYVNKLLIQSMIKEDEEPLAEAEKILHTLLSGWEEVAQQEEGKEAVMQNTQQVYAGLTYGKGNLNESVVGNQNRGFKA